MRKIIKMKEIVVLSLEGKENVIELQLNGAKFIYEDEVVKEIDKTATLEQRKEIEAKYTKNEEGKYSEEDIEAMRKEVKQYDTYEEVEVYIGEDMKPLKDIVKDILSK